MRADYTVTFTAPKVGQVLPPACDRVGELRVCPIGSPPALYENDDSIYLSLVEPAMFNRLLGPRPPGAHKGDFGHVLVIGGSRGKTGAAAMTGMAALRAGAGLVTVASAASAIPVIAAHAPELMTEALPETEDGSIRAHGLRPEQVARLIKLKDVVALGPGLGTHPETVAAVHGLLGLIPQYLVIDADGLNALAGMEFTGRNLILTPHPGEMARLTGKRTGEVQADRVGTARGFATERGVTLVLKGQRTLIAFPDGRVWINPTGTPAMATGGSGDILTGLIAGLLAQAPQEPEAAIAAAVYLHGLAGEFGAEALGEQALIATDLLEFLPEALDECRVIRTRSEEETIALGEEIARALAAPRGGAAHRRPGRGQDHARQGHRERSGRGGARGRHQPDLHPDSRVRRKGQGLPHRPVPPGARERGAGAGPRRPSRQRRRPAGGVGRALPRPVAREPHRDPAGLDRRGRSGNNRYRILTVTCAVST